MTLDTEEEGILAKILVNKLFIYLFSKKKKTNFIIYLDA
jgi:hypothetical protein